MKVGDLVKYSVFPHEELSKLPLAGLVLHLDTFLYLEKAFIMWNRPKARGIGGREWEYLDELEVISESR